MSNGNPYYVHPAGDMSQGLAGLSAVLKDVGEKRQAREAQEAQTAVVQAAFESGDPAQVAKAALQYPQLSVQLFQAMEIQQEAQKKEVVEFGRSVLVNPAGADALYRGRIESLEAQGRDSTQTRQSYQDYLANPGAELQELEMVFAGMAPNEYKAFKKDSAKASSPLGKLKQDLDSGFITRGQYDSAVRTQTEQDAATGQSPLGKIQADINAGLLTAEQGALLEEQVLNPTPGGEDQRERRKADYMRLYRMSEAEATRAVDADIRLDERGNLIAYDPTTGGAKRVDVDLGAEAALGTGFRLPDTEIESLAFDPGKGTGFGASFLGLWNATAGQLPFLPTLGTEAEETAQQLRFLERDAIKALASSGRPPVVEQERIISAMPQAMEWFENPDVARAKMTSFVDLMMMQYIDDKRHMEDPRNDRQARSASRNRAKSIEGIMKRVLTPEAAESMFRSLNRVETEIKEIRTMSMAELEKLDASSLGDAELEVYIQRLREGDAD